MDLKNKGKLDLKNCRSPHKPHHWSAYTVSQFFLACCCWGRGGIHNIFFFSFLIFYKHGKYSFTNWTCSESINTRCCCFIFLFCLFEVCVEVKTSERKPQDETTRVRAYVHFYLLFVQEGAQGKGKNIKAMHFHSATSSSSSISLVLKGISAKRKTIGCICLYKEQLLT